MRLALPLDLFPSDIVASTRRQGGAAAPPALAVGTAGNTPNPKFLTQVAIKVFLLLASLWAHSLSGQETNLNARIVQFCRSHLGQEVGDGECYSLAKHAFKDAGLAGGRQPENPNHGDFVWGRLVLYLQGTGGDPVAQGKMEAIMPGDVIQFRDAVFKGKKRSERFPHHTAVVVAVGDNGREVKLLQQNFGGKKFVTELNLHLTDLKAGWIRVYQPAAAKAKGEP
jgi:hypothetical protein